MVAFLVPMNLFGNISKAQAVIGHEGSTLLVALDNLRFLKKINRN